MVCRCAPMLTSSAPLQLTLHELIEACLQPRRAMEFALLPYTTRNCSQEFLLTGSMICNCANHESAAWSRFLR